MSPMATAPAFDLKGYKPEGDKKNSEFFQIASTTKTDKITKHDYHHLYGAHLGKWSHRNTGAFLEIGWGCTMGYGPGESADIWTQLFNHVYFVEYDKKCVDKHADRINKAAYGVFVGDQADVAFLEKMKYEIMGEVGSLEVVIDDGGHHNHQVRRLPPFSRTSLF